MPRLTVLMPVHNGAATVAAAVSSTLRAMPKDAELVIWDDASTDATLAQIARVVDRRVRLVESAAKVGPGAAVRSLLAGTDSRFVARMDADDVCLPGRFALQLAYLQRRGCDILFSPVVRFRTHPPRFAPSAPMSISARAMPLHLAVMCVVMQPTMLATRQAIDGAGGYRDALAEDYDLWLRASTLGIRLERMPIPTVGYRRHDAQLSFSVDFQRDASRDARLAESYRAFTRGLLGVESVWIPGTRVESAEQRASIETLAGTIRDRARDLSAPERMLVERTLRHLPSLG